MMMMMDKSMHKEHVMVMLFCVCVCVSALMTMEVAGAATRACGHIDMLFISVPSGSNATANGSTLTLPSVDNHSLSC